MTVSELMAACQTTARSATRRRHLITLTLWIAATLISSPCFVAGDLETELQIDEHVASPHPLPDVVIMTVVESLEDSHDGNVRGQNITNSYTTAALLLPYMTPKTRQHTTLLIPSNAALVAFAPQARGMSPAGMQALAQFHMLKANLSFQDLSRFPVGTLLPTVLGDSYRVRLNRVVGAAPPNDLAMGDARVVDMDICPASLATFVTCHGIDRVITAESAADQYLQPADSNNNAQAPGQAAPTPSPTPAASQPISDPSPSPSETKQSSNIWNEYPASPASAPAPHPGSDHLYPVSGTSTPSFSCFYRIVAYCVMIFLSASYSSWL